MTHERNVGPEFNLIEEPWIPLNRIGQNEPELVGLREALLRAPQFSGLAEGNPVTKASLLRFLTAMTYLVVDEWAEQRDGRRLVRSALADGSGFSAEAVESVLAAWQDRLWLFHPDYPFCQDPRMADDTSMRAPLGPLAITPYLPGDSSSRWGINLADAESVSCDEAARLLLANWFYTPAGNSARRVKTAEETSKRVASAAGANFPSLTNIFRAGVTLFETLVSNLLRSHEVKGDERAVPAFLRVTELTVEYETLPPLYAATLSAATGLIVASEPGAATLGDNFLRGSTLFDGSYQDVAKRFTELPLSSDPHVLYLNNPQNKDNHPRQNVSGSMVALPRFCLDVAKQITSGELQKPGVLARRNLLAGQEAADELTFIQVSQGGTASSRTIEGAEELRVPGAQVSPLSALEDEPAQRLSDEVQQQLEPLLAPSKSAMSYLRYAVRHAIDPNAKSIPDGILSSVRDDFYASVGLSVSRAVEELTTGQTSPERREAMRQEWSRQVLEVFDRHAGTYRYSQSSAPRFWRARDSLSFNLRKVLA